MAILSDILTQASGELLSRGDLAGRYDEVRSDAAARASRLIDEAKREGAGLLALAARHGVEIARDYGIPLVTGRHRRPRSAARLWAAAFAILAVAAVVVATSRD
jgi:hypothetical protein